MPKTECTSRGRSSQQREVLQALHARRTAHSESGTAVEALAHPRVKSSNSSIVKIKAELSKLKSLFRNAQRRESTAKHSNVQEKERCGVAEAETLRAEKALEDSQGALQSTTMELEISQAAHEESHDELEKSRSALEEARLQLQQLEAEVQSLHEELQISIDASMQQMQDMTAHCASLETEARARSLDPGNLHVALKVTQTELRAVRERKPELDRRQDATRKRLWRQPIICERAISHAVSKVEAARTSTCMEGKGSIKQEVRDLIRQLAGIGVATHRINTVIHDVTVAFGLTVADSVSARTVSRLVLEGLIQAKMQIAYEIGVTTDITVAYDGTTIRHEQHEANILWMPVPTYNWSINDPDSHAEPTLARKVAIRTLGVHKVASHTGRAQFEGFVNRVSDCFDALKGSDLGARFHGSIRTFAKKLSGGGSDHSADAQKPVEHFIDFEREEWAHEAGEASLAAMSFEERVCTVADVIEDAATAGPRATGRSVFGSASIQEESVEIAALAALPYEERLRAIAEALDEAVCERGVLADLPEDEQGEAIQNVWKALVIAKGDEEFHRLTPEEQADVIFFAWVGCCMHKDLNVIRYGVARMHDGWKKHDLTPPCALANKFHTQGAALSTGTKRGEKELVEAPCGGVRATILAGLLFNNKDDKAGYHGTYLNFFEKSFGYACRFPGTAKSRLDSHCAAAAELLVNMDVYIGFLEQCRDAKTHPGFTDIEQNLHNALHDVPTLTELAILALRGQAIGHPYIQHVRAYAGSAVELGPFHTHLKEHIRHLIAHPELLLGEEVTSESGAFLGRMWDRPHVVFCVLRMARGMPDLSTMLVEYLEGELNGWDRFSKEWHPDSMLMRATDAQRARAYVAATNDACEGALGQARVLTRERLYEDNQRNGRLMYLQNGTIDFVRATFTDADYQRSRTLARVLDASGAAAVAREEHNTEEAKRAEETRARQAKSKAKKNAFVAKLRSIDLERDKAKLARFSNALLDNQIDKIRSFDPKMPAKSTLPRKDKKLEAIAEALARLASGEADVVNHSESGEPGPSGVSRSTAEDEEMDGEVDALPDDVEMQYEPDL